MPSLLLLSTLPLLLYTINTLHHLYKNYLLGRQTGLRIVIVPFDPYSLLWQLLYQFFGPLIQHIQWCRIIEPTWSWQDDVGAHKNLGESFVVVSPVKNIIYTSDKVAIDCILSKRKEFIKPDIYENLDLFGKNVDTVNGEDWSRHRKITAPCFNERVSSFVWDESLRQARSMLSHWLSQPKGKISGMVDDTRIIALHVLYAAGFGVSHDFLGGARNPSPGHVLSHRDALMTILNNLITSIIVSKMAWLEKVKRILSPRLNHVLLALKEFRQYTDEAIASERQILAEGTGATKPNLISTLIRTSDEAKAERIQAGARLSDEEIKGNIFIFNLAGHDTTANTLAYAFALLAVHPEVREWVSEEIDEVLGEEENPKYEETYPRLKRVLAVMYETLRLYGPVPHIPRGTASPNTPLLITNPDPTSTSPTTTLLVPANTQLNMNLHACHTSPTNFPNPKVWDPKRWISSAPSLAEEKFLSVGLGFAPWSTGPRICPGMKFAQVEFTGVLSTVLRRARVDPSVKGDAEASEEKARKVVMCLIRDSSAQGPTLSLGKPEEVTLKVSSR